MKENTLKTCRFNLCGSFLIIGFSLCAGSLFILAYQILMWWENGFWTKHSVEETLPGLSFWIISWEDWFGVQKILLWVFDLELSIFAFFLGLIISLYFLHMATGPFQNEGIEDSSKNQALGSIPRSR